MAHAIAELRAITISNIACLTRSRSRRSGIASASHRHTSSLGSASFSTSSASGLENDTSRLFGLHTVAQGKVWAQKKIDHDITRLVSNVADTDLPPEEVARETLTIIREIVGKSVTVADGTGPEGTAVALKLNKV
jgi:hypothetical protein